MEAETTKPHLNLMADGSEKHKHAMLSSPLESVAIGGKLLEGWTTPDFPSVFSHGQASIQLAAALMFAARIWRNESGFRFSSALLWPRDCC